MLIILLRSRNCSDFRADASYLALTVTGAIVEDEMVSISVGKTSLNITQLHTTSTTYYHKSQTSIIKRWNGKKIA